MKNLLAIVVCLLCCWPCYAQSDRYELGKRVRRFELAWQAADGARRAASAAPMQQAVKSFFTLQYAGAARELDNAYFIARQAAPAAAFEQAALALRLDVQPVAIDAQLATCQFKIQPYYKLKPTADEADRALETAQVKLKLIDGDQRSYAQFDLAWNEVVVGTELKFKDVPEGDYWVQASIEALDQKISLPTLQVSLVRDLDGRVKKLDEWLKNGTVTGAAHRCAGNRQADGAAVCANDTLANRSPSARDRLSNLATIEAERRSHRHTRTNHRIAARAGAAEYLANAQSTTSELAGARAVAGRAI